MSSNEKSYDWLGNEETSPLQQGIWEGISNNSLRVSVIAVTRNRATYLQLVLAGLERQFLAFDSWEVIIVDEASQDQTPSVLEAFQQNSRLSLKSLRTTVREGHAACLNLAASAARGDLLIFLGATRLVGPDFLQSHLDRQEQMPGVVIGDDHFGIHTNLFASDETAQEGICFPCALTPPDLDDPRNLEPLVAAGDHDYRSLFAYFDQQKHLVPYPWACCTFNNVSVPRQALERVGRFDTHFSNLGMEDTDLAYRLHEAGIPFHYAPEAVSLRQLCPKRQADVKFLNRDLNLFLAKHPHMNAREREILERTEYPIPE